MKIRVFDESRELATSKPLREFLAYFFAVKEVWERQKRVMFQKVLAVTGLYVLRAWYRYKKRLHSYGFTVVPKIEDFDHDVADVFS